MNADNLATCLAQSLVSPPSSMGGGLFPINLGEHNNLVKSLLIQYHWIFEEAEADQGEEEEEEEEEDIDEEAVASDSEEELDHPQVTCASTSRLNISEDDVFVDEPAGMSHTNGSRGALNANERAGSR